MSIRILCLVSLIIFSASSYSQEQGQMSQAKKEYKEYEGRVVEVIRKFEVATSDIMAENNEKATLDWASARKACEDYTEGTLKDDWSLPDKALLQSIYEQRKSRKDFKNSFSGGYYWSRSTTPAIYALAVSFETTGDVKIIDKNKTKYNSGTGEFQIYTRCVRAISEGDTYFQSAY